MNSLKLSRIVDLAEASYGKFSDDIADTEEIKRALLVEKVSLAQINDLIRQYSIVNHRPNTHSGLSATLFQEKGSVSNAGLTLAIRGTEPGFLGAGVDVISADLGGIVVEGAALNQITDLYNYWKQLTSASGATVRLARIVETDDPNASAIFTPAMSVGTGSSARVSYRRIEFFDQAGAGLGVINGPVSNVTVTGHSLGGHLATAFQRLFPQVVGEVYTVNGAGTRETDIASRFFDVLAGRHTSFDSTRINNLYGSAGPNVVSGELVYTQIGDRGEIYTEGIMDVGGHGNKQMTDSAAVYDLFIRADDGFKTQGAAQLSASLSATFKAADAQAGFTLEALVNAFGKLFVPDFLPISRDLADQRELLHAKIVPIRDRISASTAELDIELLGDKSTEQLASLASTHIAYRYALRELNPFAVLGADYAPHNTDGSLDLYDAATGRGLTGPWLEARARFLQAVMDYNSADGAVNANAIGAHFEDRARGIAFGPINATTARIVFGGDGQALVAGGSANSDSLVGANGADALSGAAGDDYLEGGAGADTLDGGVGDDQLFGNDGDDVLIAGGDLDALNGGAGFDRYEAESGAGFTVIRDSDGRGQVLISGQAVEGGAKRSGNVFHSEDGAFTFSFSGDLASTGTLTIGNDVRVENFHNGDLGIVLTEGMESESPIAEFVYSRYAWPDNVVFDGQNDALFYGSYANDLFLYGEMDQAHPAAGGDPERPDQLDGQTYRGWGGDDLYAGAYHYGETFLGDAGNDVILGGALGAQYSPIDGMLDVDQLYGGGGRDTIVGGKGDDALYGDFQAGDGGFSAPASLQDLQSVSLDFWTAAHGSGAYVQAEGRSETARSRQYDYAGGHGFEVALRDYLGLEDAEDINEFYDDHVSGGPGDDRIVGGYGSDTLLGDEGNDWIDGDSLGSRVRALPLELRVLFGRPGDDYLDGGEGDDTLLDRSGGNDALYGGDGNDLLDDRNGGNDALYGGTGNDELINYDPYVEEAAWQSFSNYLEGGDGDDTLFSSNDSTWGFDYVDGGAGNDALIVGSNERFGGGDVFVLGGTGDDVINVGSLNGHVDGGAGDDTIAVFREDDEFGNDRHNDTDTMFIFGGTGDDDITANGPVNINGGDGDDSIAWESSYQQVAVGFVRGGSGNDFISIDGPADVDGGDGDDEIRVIAGNGSVTPGAGRDRIVIGVGGGAGSDLVLDPGDAGAGNVDSLVFEPLSGDAVSPGDLDLHMRRSGNDLQLDLVGAGADAPAQARVRVLDWFAGGASQLETISVAGLRSWTAAEATALATPIVVATPVVDVPPEAPPVPPVAPGAEAVPGTPPPTFELPTSTSVATQGAVAAAVPLLAGVSDIESTELLQPLLLGGGTPGATNTAKALATSALSAEIEPADSGVFADDSVAAFLEQLRDKHEFRFSFSAEAVQRVQAPESEDAVHVSPGRIAAQWSALHAYMDELAMATDLNERYAARAVHFIGQTGISGFATGGFGETGITDPSRIEIRDSSLGTFQRLPGLSEGFAQIG